MKRRGYATEQRRRDLARFDGLSLAGQYAHQLAESETGKTSGPAYKAAFDRYLRQMEGQPPEDMRAFALGKNKIFKPDQIRLPFVP